MEKIPLISMRCGIGPIFYKPLKKGSPAMFGCCAVGGSNPNPALPPREVGNFSYITRWLMKSIKIALFKGTLIFSPWWRLRMWLWYFGTAHNKARHSCFSLTDVMGGNMAQTGQMLPGVSTCVDAVCLLLHLSFGGVYIYSSPLHLGRYSERSSSYFSLL